MDNRLDHRTIVKWQRESARLLPLMVRNEFADAEPLIPSRDGFVLTADNRLAFQFMLQSQAQKHGMNGLTPHEAYALMGRLENMPRIEDNFQHAQAGVLSGIKSYCLRRSHNRRCEIENPTSDVIWIDDLREILS